MSAAAANYIGGKKVISTKEYPADKNMDVVPVRVGDIAEAQGVELLVAGTTAGVQRQQYRPGDDAPDQAHDRHHPQEPQEEVTVQRGMAQDMAVGQLEEGPEPVDETARKLRAPFTVAVTIILFSLGMVLTYFSWIEPRYVLGA